MASWGRKRRPRLFRILACIRRPNGRRHMRPGRDKVTLTLLSKFRLRNETLGCHMVPTRQRGRHKKRHKHPAARTSDEDTSQQTKRDLICPFAGAACAHHSDRMRSSALPAIGFSIKESTCSTNFLGHVKTRMPSAASASTNCDTHCMRENTDMVQTKQSHKKEARNLCGMVCTQWPAKTIHLP